MVIGGIVISGAYYALMMVNRQFASYRDINEKVSGVYLLHSVLLSDLTRAERVLKRSGHEIEIVDPRSDKTILYGFGENTVTRKNPVSSDTFYVQTSNLQTKSVEGIRELIAELRLDVSLENENSPFVFIKEYSSDVLLKQEELSKASDLE